MKIKILFTLFIMCSTIATMACPACEAQQPAILKGVSHGVPQSQYDYIIVAIVAAIVLVAGYFAVKWMIRPGEKNANHIKRTILNFE